MATRQRRNQPEAQFDREARNRGLEPTKRGWPDFLVFRPDGSAFAVEVKRAENHHPGRYQRRVLNLLSKLGLPCFVYRPTTGLQPWKIRETKNGVYSSSLDRSEKKTGKKEGDGELEAEIGSTTRFVGP